MIYCIWLWDQPAVVEQAEQADWREYWQRSHCTRYHAHELGSCTISLTNVTV